MNYKKIKFKMTLLKYILYLWGFSSLIFLPYIHGFKPSDIFAICVFILILLLFLIKLGKQGYIKLPISIIFTYFVTIFYFIITIIGSILNAPNSFERSLFVTIRYFLVVTTIILIFILLNFEINKVKKYFIYFCKSFILAGIFNAIWIILDQIFYYFITPLFSINEIIFSNFNKGLEHGLTNRFRLGDYLLLRSSGFGWDPGGIGPALFICYILSDILEKNKNIKFLLLIGILLTFSKTTYLVLAVYLIIKILKNVFKIKEHIIITGTLLSFFLFLQLTVFISPIDLGKYFSEGTVRHIKYFSELYNLVYANLDEILFGYGYRGTGEFFNKYVPWLYQLHGFEFGKNSVAESTLINLFLYGGIIGGFYNLFLYVSLLLKECKFRMTIVMLVLLYLGYTFENIWSIFLVYYLWFSNFIDSKTYYEKIEYI